MVPQTPTAMTRRGPTAHPSGRSTVGSSCMTPVTGCDASQGTYLRCFLSTDSAILASSGMVNSIGVTIRRWWSRWYRSGRRRSSATVAGSGDWSGGFWWLLAAAPAGIGISQAEVCTSSRRCWDIRLYCRRHDDGSGDATWHAATGIIMDASEVGLRVPTSRRGNQS